MNKENDVAWFLFRENFIKKSSIVAIGKNANLNKKAFCHIRKQRILKKKVKTMRIFFGFKMASNHSYKKILLGGERLECQYLHKPRFILEI